MAAKRRRRRRRKSARRRILDKLLIWLAFVITVVAFTALVVIYWNRDTGIGDEQLELCLIGNTMNISWEESEIVDMIRLYKDDPDSDRTIYLGEYTENRAVLDDIVSGEELTLKFEPIRIKTFLGKSFEVKSRRKSVTIVPEELMIPKLTDKVSETDKTISIMWPADSSYTCEMYSVDDAGTRTDIAQYEESGCVYTVGEDIEMPERGKPLRFQARSFKQEKNCKQYSQYGDVLEVSREELLPNEISLVWELNMDGKYSFAWQEAKPDTYELLQYNEDTDTWETLQITGADDPMRYETDWLPSEKLLSYKLLAYFADPKTPEQKEILESAELNVKSNRSPLYCTIWPIQKLDVYSDAEGTETIGAVEAGETLCILAEENSRFKVLSSNGFGYIDERYVMINLPEYLGDLCHYDATNSYSSIFKVGPYNIPGMTGTVIPGFENICVDEDQKEFVVPYLYPCANRLAKAAEVASADDYVLKIYEAFRPHEATRYMYDTTEKILACHVPFVDDAGLEIDVPDAETDEEAYRTYMEELNALAVQQATAEGIDVQTDLGQIRILQLLPEYKVQRQAQDILTDQGIDPASAPGQVLLADMIAKQTTYELAMTNGSMKLSAFLAKATSAHNRGIALDLTLEKRSTGEEMQMQSAMHDLSYNSILSKNNDNAKLLEKYMKGVGFNGLSSEWWHFQDDETRNELNLGVYLENGVSLKGWKNNNVGWRYQLDDGSFIKDRTETINGAAHTFDEKGYCHDFDGE